MGACNSAEERAMPLQVLKLKAFYTAPMAPSPKVVDLFAREKGIDLSSVECLVDIGAAAESRKGAHLKRNPSGQVPYFELEDGTIIAESVAMCEYLEDMVPEPPLIGRSPEQRACTRMWMQRLQEHYIWPAFCAFRCWTASADCDGMFKDYFSKPLARGHAALLPSAYKDMQAWALARLRWLEAQKAAAQSRFICGNELTLVDIQVFATLNGFSGMSQPFLQEHGAELPWLTQWFAHMKERESVKASNEHIADIQRRAS
jgi:glutathione S-transferase